MEAPVKKTDFIITATGIAVAVIVLIQALGSVINPFAITGQLLAILLSEAVVLLAYANYKLIGLPKIYWGRGVLKGALVGLIALLGASFITWLWVSLLENLGVPVAEQPMLTELRTATSWEFFLILFVAGIWGPLIEEIYFRGWWQNFLFEWLKENEKHTLRKENHVSPRELGEKDAREAAFEKNSEEPKVSGAEGASYIGQGSNEGAQGNATGVSNAATKTEGLRAAGPNIIPFNEGEAGGRRFGLSIIIVAFAFSLLHGNFALIPGLLTAGICFGYAAQKWGLTSAVAAHTIFNSITIVAAKSGMF